MVPIEKLPAEILVRIFRQLRDIHVHLRSRGWLTVTHVCHVWRLAALDAAELWTQIYSFNMDCIQVFLARSKCAPLDIYYPDADHHGPQRSGFTLYQSNRFRDIPLEFAIPILFSVSRRFRRVELAHPGTAHMFLEHHVPGGAPLLSHLTLVFIPRRTDLVAPIPVPPLTDAPMTKIYDQGLPALQQLSLTFWPVARLAPLRGLLNPALRSLTMDKPHTRHSIKTWADILTDLPRLEELVLTFVFPIPLGPESQERISLIRLPHLLSLQLVGDSPADQLALLQHIAPSSDVHITFSARSIPSDTNFVFERHTDIFHALGQKFLQEQRKTFAYPTSLDLRLNTLGVMGLLSVKLSAALDDFGNSYCSTISSNSTTKPVLLLWFCGEGGVDRRLSAPLCDMLHTTFAWSTLYKLSLGPRDRPGTFHDGLELKAFKSLFLQMTAVRVLSIGKSYSSDHLSFLLAPFDRSEGLGGVYETTATSQVLFPALELLTIIGWPSLGEAEYGPLCHALLSRKQAGYPPPRVHLCLPVKPYYQYPTGPVNWVAVKHSVRPLTSIGCSVDVCEGSRIRDRCIKELASAE